MQYPSTDEMKKIMYALRKKVASMYENAAGLSDEKKDDYEKLLFTLKYVTHLLYRRAFFHVSFGIFDDGRDLDVGVDWDLALAFKRHADALKATGALDGPPVRLLAPEDALWKRDYQKLRESYRVLRYMASRAKKQEKQGRKTVDVISKKYPDAVILTNPIFDSAIVGVDGTAGRVIYSVYEMLKIILQHHKEWKLAEACSYITADIIARESGDPHAPIFMYDTKGEDAHDGKGGADFGDCFRGDAHRCVDKLR